MAQIDMSKKETTTGNSAEVEKLANAEPTKTPEQPAELTNNTTEKQEDTKETDKGAKPAENKGQKSGTVVATYVGTGIWKDEAGELWANTKPAGSDNILSERQYSAEEFESREDLKFMVEYGAIKTTVVK